MSAELSKEDFLYIVKEFNLSCEYDITELNDKKLIVEIWSSKSNPFIKLTKMYEFSLQNIKDIEKSEKKKLLNKMLSNAVEVENYEFAATLRDIINEL